MKSFTNKFNGFKAKGFTLVELLVVVSLISIISGFGFASLADYSKKQVISQAAQDVKQTVNLARFNSISSVKPQTSPSGQTCTTNDQLISYKLNFCDFTTCTSTNPAVKYEIVAYCGAKSIVVSTKSLTKGVTFSSQGIDPSELCKSLDFEARTGVSTGTPCQVQMDNIGANSLMLSVDENGNTSIQ